MTKMPRSNAPRNEEELVALLATLRVEPVKEADFEARFLCEFHERVAREAVCCPARRHLLAHLLQMVDNFGRGRLAFGASALGLGAVALCFALYPAGQTAAGTAASVAVERQRTPLYMPALSNDLDACTTIRVEPAQQSSLEVGGVLVTRNQHATIIEVPNGYAPAANHIEIYSTVAPRQAAPAALPSSAVRYAF